MFSRGQQANSAELTMHVSLSRGYLIFSIFSKISQHQTEIILGCQLS